MNLRPSRGGVIGLVVFLALAGVVTMFLSDRFGGPAIPLGDAYRLSVSIRDSRDLSRKSDVSVRGVKVGAVEQIEMAGDRAEVTMTIDRDKTPVWRDAAVRVGQKTVLGEAYLELSPGNASAGQLPDGGRIARVRPSVDVDDALTALNRPARRNLRSLLLSAARGARSPRTPARFAETLRRTGDLVSELRRLTSVLAGQSSDIAGFVTDSGVVLGELGRRERSLRAIVSSGRATFAALDTQRAALQAGLTELGPLLDSGRVVLRDARPLLRAARPLMADLRTASPELSAALKDLGPFADDVRRTLLGLPRLTRAAVPVLEQASPLITAARPAARQLDPALANLVPIVRYLKRHRASLAAFFANSADLQGSERDSKGIWVRFFLFLENGTAFAQTNGKFENNAYAAGDARNNKAYQPGAYPRLTPYRP